jgi:hypothetical protein
MSDEPKDGFGLDKKSRAIAKRLGKELEEAKSAAALEPPFPYVMRPFDPGFFEL